MSAAPTPTTASSRRFRLSRWIIALLIAAALATIAIGYHRFPTGPDDGIALLQPAGNAVRSAPATKVFRVGTFNIDGGQGTDEKFDLRRTASEIKACDLIGLQEVHGSFSTNGAATIAGDLGLPYVFAPTETRWWHDDFGNAMLTSLRVMHWQRFQLSRNFTFNGSHRNVLLARLAHEGRTINVLITHLDRHGDHARELREISELFQSLAEPAILIGDLNETSEYPELVRLHQMPGVVDVVSRMEPAAPVHHVDWIFLRGLTSPRSGFDDHGVSDHPFYWADVEINMPLIPPPVPPPH